MIAALWVEPALARNVKVCLEVPPYYDDASPHRPVRDDYRNQNYDATVPELRWKASGLLVDAVRQSPPYNNVVAYAGESGANNGCAVLDLVAGASYAIRAHSWAKADTHTLKVHPDVTAADKTRVLQSSYVVPALPLPAQVNAVLPAGDVDPIWQNTLLMQWGIHHRDAGLVNETWDFYAFPNPETGGQGFWCDLDFDGLLAPSCHGDTSDPDDDRTGLFINNDDRYALAHELGHYVLRKRNELYGGGNDYTAPTNGCDNGSTTHEFQSLEYKCEAMHEGWASFYAAVTFNDGSEPDCFVNYWKKENYDFDLGPQGQEDPDGHVGIYQQGSTVYSPSTTNCEGIPDHDEYGSWIDDPMDPQISHDDYLWDAHVLENCGILLDRGTEYDFVRFAWDLHTDHGWTIARIADVLDYVNPTDVSCEFNEWNLVMEAIVAPPLFTTIERDAWFLELEDHGLHR